MGREYPEAPIVGVGAVIIHRDKVLLVRRANEPSRGRWSVPGGTVELGETLDQAVQREVREECHVEIKVGDVLSTFDMIQRDGQGRIRYHYVLIDLAAEYVRGEPQAGTDALQVRWVQEAEFNQMDIVPRLLPVLRSALCSGVSTHGLGGVARRRRCL
jgi:8-oxo-dGTP diphosphatase